MCEDIACWSELACISKVEKERLLSGLVEELFGMYNASIHPIVCQLSVKVHTKRESRKVTMMCVLCYNLPLMARMQLQPREGTSPVVEDSRDEERKKDNKIQISVFVFLSFYVG